MGNFANVTLGIGAVTQGSNNGVGGTDLGFVKGDCSLNVNKDLVDFKTGVPLVLQGSIIREFGMTLKVPMAELFNTTLVSAMFGGQTPSNTAASPVQVNLEALTFAPYVTGAGLQAVVLDGINVGNSPAPVLTSSTGQVAGSSPSAGSSVVISLASTTGYTVGKKVVVHDGSHTEVCTISAVSANTSITVTTLANSYTTPTIYLGYVENTDYTVDYNLGIAFRVPGGGISSLAAILATYSYTPNAAVRWNLGVAATFAINTSVIEFTHVNPQTGKYWRIHFNKARAKGSLDVKFSEQNFTINELEFAAIQDQSNSTAPFGWIEIQQ